MSFTGACFLGGKVYKANSVEKLSIGGCPVNATLEKGEQLKIIVTSNLFPNLLRLRELDENGKMKFVDGKLTLHHSEKHPSSIDFTYR